ncbi:MAG: alpha/beta fold hydrolase [Candidatus Binatia bacterium]
MTSLHAERLGRGEPVILVHGSVIDGAATWSAQRPLAERWALVIVDRRGFGQSPDTDGEDFERDAEDIADLLGEGAHLVGHSYGGVGCLLAAARRPEAVRSLTLVEPVAYGVCRDDPVVQRAVREIDAWFDTGPEDPREFLVGFLGLMGAAARLPSPLPPALERGARLLRHIRYPWTAEIPLDALEHAPFRSLVVSGGHSEVFDAICDVLAERLGAE